MIPEPATVPERKRKLKRVSIWLLIAAVVGFIVAILAIGIIIPMETHGPPLTIEVVPVPIGWPPLAPSSACALPPQLTGMIQGHIAENESAVRVRIAITPEIKVTGVTIEAMEGEPYLASVYAACASTLPRYTGTPNAWKVIRLPEGFPSAPIPIPGLQPGKTFNLIVQPPLYQMSAEAYIWRIVVTFTGPTGMDTYFGDWFATLAPSA